MHGINSIKTENFVESSSQSPEEDWGKWSWTNVDVQASPLLIYDADGEDMLEIPAINDIYLNCYSVSWIWTSWTCFFILVLNSNQFLLLTKLPKKLWSLKNWTKLTHFESAAKLRDTLRKTVSRPLWHPIFLTLVIFGFRKRILDLRNWSSTLLLKF